jgi:hypothetical protein
MDAVGALIDSVKLTISEAKSCHGSDVDVALVFLENALASLQTASIELMRKVNALQMKEQRLATREFESSRW